MNSGTARKVEQKPPKPIDDAALEIEDLSDALDVIDALRRELEALRVIAMEESGHAVRVSNALKKRVRQLRSTFLSQENVREKLESENQRLRIGMEKLRKKLELALKKRMSHQKPPPRKKAKSKR